MNGEKRRAVLVLSLMLSGMLAVAAIGTVDGIVAKVLLGTVAALQAAALWLLPTQQQQ